MWKHVDDEENQDEGDADRKDVEEARGKLSIRGSKPLINNGAVDQVVQGPRSNAHR